MCLVMVNGNVISKLGAQARSFGGQVADFLMPPKCLVCHDAVSNHGGACPSCWNTLPIIEAPRCEWLGIPFPFDSGPGVLSARALALPPAWNRARGAVEFDDCSRQLVHALKYRDLHHVAGMMSAMMVRAGTDIFPGADALVPVPLHRTRLWQRRFNQSGLLAERVSKTASVRFQPDFLTRVRPTRTQVGLDHIARRRNLRGAFEVDESVRLKVSGRNIILVDDVLTTGATAEACARTLLKAGAERVDVLVFALVIQPLRLHI
jgi:ComF family protein